ncbi:MAG: DUF3524 domain-containing protein [Planctomycetes bacterium]|nr:DUF3524 domain-containing protein [Planctomycetota bacterium]
MAAMSNGPKSLRIAAIEPYHGGSHKAFLEALAKHSQHAFQVFAQSPRKWKWRMRGSALHFQKDLASIGACDLVLASDFLNLAEFLGLARSRWPNGAAPPVVLFMHENQLTYPVRSEDERDYHYAFTNITSCLAADAVWFNSAFHRDAFLAAVPAYLKRMPDDVPSGIEQEIAKRSRVMALGVEVPDASKAATRESNAPLRIGWNHRWEFDKNPEAFFAALYALRDENVPFEAVVLGEQFRDSPDVFKTAKGELGPRVAHWGYAPSREAYFELLAGCDVVASSAIHEFFGLSVVEAALCGCALQLPKRLSYSEIVPPALHGEVLYDNDHELAARLKAFAARPGAAHALGAKLREALAKYRWSERIAEYDAAFANAAVWA